MKKCLLQKVLILAFTGFLFCTACRKGETAAVTMNLAKTEGSVEISDGGGKNIEPVDNLNLYSGYDMRTKAISYAWINLDHEKLVKMDEDSRGMIQKEGKNLIILMNSGNLFFHVKEPLEEDETMGIRTSTMTVGIRGTCGWIERESREHSQVYVLEGKVAVTAGREGKTTDVSAGQTADVSVSENGETEITVSEFTVRDIPEFVLSELTLDEKLAEKILEASGLDVLSPPEEGNQETAAESKEEMNERAKQAYQKILNEYIEAGADVLNDAGALFMDAEPFREKYPNAGASVAYYAANYSFYSAYYDINGDGVEELLIGAENEGTGIVPAALFVYDNEEARLVYGDSQSALSLCSFSVMSDKTVFGRQSGGGDFVNISLWKLGDDGYTLENILEDTWSHGIDGGDYRDFEQEKLDGRTEIEISGWQLLTE